MFDVGFSEMIVIAIVALIVIGPEKLPKVARTIGLLVGRMQRYVGNVKSDIEREMQFEDLQKLQQEIKQGYSKTRADLNDAASNAKKEVAALEREIESSLVTDHSVQEQPAILPKPVARQQSLDLDLLQQPSAQHEPSISVQDEQSINDKQKISTLAQPSLAVTPATQSASVKPSE